MSRYTGPRFRIARRLGGAELPGLFVPRELRRTYPPGQHGPTQRIKLSDYAIRLREKQKLRAHYGVSEKQIRRYMVKAKAAKGNTGTNLLVSLESRLDNVVFRLGFASREVKDGVITASTMRAARQLVNHGHIEVNGHRLDIPSYQVRVGDVIKVREKSKTREGVAKAINGPTTLALPSFLERNDQELTGTIKAKPEASDCPLVINESLVVELYALSL